MFKTCFEIRKVRSSGCPEIYSAGKPRIGMNRGNSQLSIATLDAFGNHCPAKLVSSRQKSLTSGRACASLAIKLLRSCTTNSLRSLSLGRKA